MSKFEETFGEAGTVNGYDVYDVELFVKEITASCRSDKAELERTMRAVDLESVANYSHAVSMTLPAMPGVGTGDIIKIKVRMVRTAAHEEERRAQKRLADEQS